LQRRWRKPVLVALASVLCFGGGKAAKTETAKTAGTPSLVSQSSPPQAGLALAAFVDVTAVSGVPFQGQSYHTSRKYLIETIGFRVALVDYDNDGRLDIFFTNGAMIPVPTVPGTIPKKSGPKDGNRLYHQRADGTFGDVTEKAGLAGSGYDLGVAAADCDNDGYEAAPPPQSDDD
jgi:hypothetical protein